jgi:hypothetical protein
MARCISARSRWGRRRRCIDLSSPRRSPLKSSSPNRDARFGNAERKIQSCSPRTRANRRGPVPRESIHDQVQLFRYSCNSVGAVSSTGDGATHDRRARPVRLLSSERRSRHRLDKVACRRDGVGSRQCRPGSNENGDQAPFASRQAGSVHRNRCRSVIASLRANGSRECAPDDRLREAIRHCVTERKAGGARLTKTVVARLDRAIQYTAASRFYRWGLWNTGSPGQAGR